MVTSNGSAASPLSSTISMVTTLTENISTSLIDDNRTMYTNLTSTSSVCDVGYTIDECAFIIRFEKILSPILMVLIIIGLIANVFVVYGVIVHENLRNFANLFMANLSATHLVYLIVIGATDLYDYVMTAQNVRHDSVIPESIHLYISLVITNCDVAMLTALSIERYVAITIDPKKLAKFKAAKVATGACALVWSVSLVVCAPIFYGVDSGSYDISAESFKVAMIISFVVSYVIPLIAITIIYFAIRRKLRRRGASMRVKKGDEMVTRTPEEYRLYQDQQILRGIIVIVLLYTFNFGARYITKIILYLSIPIGNLMIFVTTQLSEIAAILTASLQPLVYVALHPNFSKLARDVITCFRARGGKGCECCQRCGECYIACRTCCGLFKLAPLPQLSMRSSVNLDNKRSKIHKLTLVQNIELEIVPPEKSPTEESPTEKSPTEESTTEKSPTEKDEQTNAVSIHKEENYDSESSHKSE